MAERRITILVPQSATIRVADKAVGSFPGSLFCGGFNCPCYSDYIVEDENNEVAEWIEHCNLGHRQEKLVYYEHHLVRTANCLKADPKYGKGKFTIMADKLLQLTTQGGKG